MKKALPLIIFFIIHISSIVAQNTVGLSVGYGFPSGSQILQDNYATSSNSGVTTSSEQGVYGSYGSGLVIAASYQHFFSKTLGIDAGIQYLEGKQYKGTSVSNYYGTLNSTSNASSRARGFFINPSVIMMMDRAGIRPYLKLGVSLGHIGIYHELVNNNQTSSTTSTTQTQKGELTGGLPVGLTGALGMDIPVSTKLNLFTEVNFTSMSYYATKFETTEYTRNGADLLSTLTVSDRQTTFKRQVSTNSSQPSNSGQPDVQISQSMPLGSIRIQAGVRMKLGSQ